MNIQFREYKSAEIDTISKLMFSLNKEDSEEMPQSVEKITNFFLYVARHDDVKVYVVEYNNQVGGYAILVFFGYSLEFDGKVAQLDELYLQTELRNKGIGSQFIAFLENKAKEQSCKSMMLVATSQNERAHRLYKKLSFTPLRRTEYVKVI